MKLVLVEWHDSFGCSPDWQPLGPIQPKPLVCKSVGWLAYDGKDCKVIVPHISNDHDNASRHGCGDMTIPTCSIIKLTILRK